MIRAVRIVLYTLAALVAVVGLLLVFLATLPGRAVVASLADENINLNAYRASSHHLIVPTGRAPMYVMLDVLFLLLTHRQEALSGDDV